MRIGLVAPMVSPIVAHGLPLGGAQALLADLARGLSALGHAVTLIAARDSSLPGVAVPDLGIDSTLLAPAAFHSDNSYPPADTAQQQCAFATVRTWLDSHLDEFDLIHAHAYDAPAFHSLAGLTRPVVHTLHLPPLATDVVAAARMAEASATLVAVSQASAKGWRDAGVGVRQVIHNGVDVDAIPHGLSPEGYLLCPGRISPEKGTHLAIQVAAKLSLPLVLAGSIYDRAYFETAVKPRLHPPTGQLGHLQASGTLDAWAQSPNHLAEHARQVQASAVPGGQAGALQPAGEALDLPQVHARGGPDQRRNAQQPAAESLGHPQAPAALGSHTRAGRPTVEYLGHLTRPELYQRLARAACVVLPVQWDEPFGLVAVEAQAAGTPVASFRRGALPEVVDDGCTGALASPDDVQALTRAVRTAMLMSRPACRDWASTHFSLAAMLDAHEQLYQALLAESPHAA